MKFPRIKATRVSLLAALYIVAATAPRVAAFLLLPVYAFVLPPDELAAYGVAVAMVQLIGILTDAGILQGLTNTYWLQPLDYRPRYLKSTILLSRVVSLVLLVPVGIVLALFWDPLFGSGLPERGGLLILLAASYLQRGNNIAGAVHRARNEHRRFALTKLLPAGVQVVSGLLFVFVLEWGALGAVAAAPLGFLVSIIVVSLRRSEHVPLVRLSGAQLRTLVTRGLPMMPDQLSRWAQMLSLRPLMSLLTTARETAAFTFSNAPAQIVAPFNEAYEAYVAPRYYESAADGDTAVVRRLRDVTSMYLALGAMGAIAAIVLFDPIFVGFAPADYKDTAGLAAIALAGMTTRGAMALLMHNLRVENHGTALVGSVLLASLVSYGQFFLLVGTFGALSAAWSVYLYPAVACAVSLLVLRDRAHRLVSARDLVVTAASVLVVLAVMLELKSGVAGDEVLPFFWLLVLVGLAATAVVGLLVVRPRWAATMAVVRGGVSRPKERPVEPPIEESEKRPT